MLIVTQYEYFQMVRNTGIRPQVVSGIILGITTYLISTFIASGLLPVNTFLVLIPVMIVIVIAELYRKQDKPFDSLAHTFFSVFYIAVPLSLFPFAAFSRTGLNSLIPHDSNFFLPRNHNWVFSAYLGK